MSTEYDELRQMRDDLDAFADEHAEEGTDAAIRALCDRAGIDSDQFMIFATETAVAFVKAVPALEATRSAFGQAFFIGSEWQKQRKEQE